MVATVSNRLRCRHQRIFQSPFRRGNGCYTSQSRIVYVATILSVPFSSGQWLLQFGIGVEHPLDTFFQSPFRRGNGCYIDHRRHPVIHFLLSVPFSSGQWLLHDRNFGMSEDEAAFSPLFVGAMVATW